MSQHNVELVIGMLATDEAFRRRFAENPWAAIQHLAESGVELSVCERNALVRLDLRLLSRFANAIDPRLQKTDLQGGTQ